MEERPRRIGLIGGITWGATADYYRRINLEVKRRRGGHHSAEMTIHSLDLQPLLEKVHDIAAIEAVFHDAGRALQAAGSELFAVASFTGHRYIGGLRTTLPLPCIDLINSVGARLRASGIKCVGVWATSFALADAGLLSRLAEASGADLALPPADLRGALDQIVFSELADQTVSEPSIRLLRTLLRQQAAAGIDAVLLATTDFSPVAPLLSTALSDVALFDATEIHCAAIVDAALASLGGDTVQR